VTNTLQLNTFVLKVVDYDGALSDRDGYKSQEPAHVDPISIYIPFCAAAFCVQSA
jgi:hypothetical protein